MQQIFIMNWSIATHINFHYSTHLFIPFPYLNVLQCSIKIYNKAQTSTYLLASLFFSFHISFMGKKVNLVSFLWLTTNLSHANEWKTVGMTDSTVNYPWYRMSDKRHVKYYYYCRKKRVEQKSSRCIFSNSRCRQTFVQNDKGDVRICVIYRDRWLSLTLILIHHTLLLY